MDNNQKELTYLLSDLTYNIVISGINDDLIDIVCGYMDIVKMLKDKRSQELTNISLILLDVCQRSLNQPNEKLDKISDEIKKECLYSFLRTRKFEYKNNIENKNEEGVVIHESLTSSLFDDIFDDKIYVK